MQTVAVVGTGLIGTSFALAMRKAGFDGRVIGVSSDAALKEAMSTGAVDEGASLEDAVPRADLIYLAQPIQKIISSMRMMRGLVRPDALVTDAGSTKRAIVAAASVCGYFFLGGHPMAGKESRGALNAEAGLFVDRPYFLTPSRIEDVGDARAVEFSSMLDSIGALRMTLSADEHDRVVAASSHLPQLVSTALASLLNRQPNMVQLAAGAGPGLMDMTRLAMSSHEIWADILATNGDRIAVLLEQMEQEISCIRRELTHKRLEVRFQAGSEFAASVRAKKSNRER